MPDPHALPVSDHPRPIEAALTGVDALENRLLRWSDAVIVDARKSLLPR
ncbi:hypothetical protein HRbin40_00019 [bacterium HR40]|nr:hypothetical protein HRbin40_00019 [bacterium HR40]